ncbi:MAG: GNAT family N-acetyltransferase [Nocardioides sp.]
MASLNRWDSERMESARDHLVRVWSRRQARKLEPIVLDPDLVSAQSKQALDQVWSRLGIFDSEAGPVWVIDDSSAPTVVLVEAHVAPVGSQAAQLMEALLEQYPQARSLGIEVVPSDPWSVAFGELDGFTSRATNMHRSLPVPGPQTPVVLAPMTRAEFAAFQAWQIEDYIQDLIGTGMAEDTARAEASTQVSTLLLGGLETPDTDLMTAWVDGVDVGVLWLDYTRGYAFVYNVMVREPMRGRGLGRAVMNAGAGRALERGMTGIGLNVFAANPTARSLYDSLGYLVTADHRIRDL